MPALLAVMQKLSSLVPTILRHPCVTLASLPVCRRKTATPDIRFMLKRFDAIFDAFKWVWVSSFVVWRRRPFFWLSLRLLLIFLIVTKIHEWPFECFKQIFVVGETFLFLDPSRSGVAQSVEHPSKVPVCCYSTVGWNHAGA